MQRSGSAFVLASCRHGEWDARVSLFFRAHGRYSGLVRGGLSSKKRNDWQPGHLVEAGWRARLFDQLGHLSGERRRDYAAGILHRPLALAALSSCCALLGAATPERMPLPRLYDAFAGLLPLDETPGGLARLVRFELALLGALGYGLDLSSCALTASTRDLAFISPRSGRAVNREAGAPWAARLLPLPPFLRDEDITPEFDELYDGLKLTGYFFENHIYPNLGKAALAQVTAKRQRMMDLVQRFEGSEVRRDEELHLKRQLNVL